MLLYSILLVSVNSACRADIRRIPGCRPSQVNLVRTISLEKNYAKETVNVIIQNTSEQPQDEYYVPFTPEKMERVGGFEVRDKKDETVTGFVVDALELDTSRYVCLRASFALNPCP